MATAPSRWRSLRRILSRSEVNGTDVFVDFGSGKGRVLVEAATHYRFCAVIGVELAENLNDVARQNIAQSRTRVKTSPVKIVSSDALPYAIPDDMTVAYFFNPFRGAIFATVIARVIASADRRPRRLRVILRNPVEEDALLATNRFRRVRVARGMRPTREWSKRNSIRMYELLPASGAEARAD